MTIPASRAAELWRSGEALFVDVRRPVEREGGRIEGSEHVIPCDTVVVAVGTRANPLLTSSARNLALTKRGYLAADAVGMTNLPGVFAGGDIVRGSATVILAMGDGKRIAGSIDAYLRGTSVAVRSSAALTPAG